MDLAALRAAGAFVDPAPIKESVTWNGHTFDVWVKRLSFADSELMASSIMEGNQRRGALILSQALLLGDKQEPIDYDDAVQLDPTLANELIEAINRVSTRPKA